MVPPPSSANAFAETPPPPPPPPSHSLKLMRTNKVKSKAKTTDSQTKYQRATKYPASVQRRADDGVSSSSVTPLTSLPRRSPRLQRNKKGVSHHPPDYLPLRAPPPMPCAHYLNDSLLRHRRQPDDDSTSSLDHSGSSDDSSDQLMKDVDSWTQSQQQITSPSSSLSLKSVLSLSRQHGANSGATVGRPVCPVPPPHDEEMLGSPSSSSQHDTTEELQDVLDDGGVHDVESTSSAAALAAGDYWGYCYGESQQPAASWSHLRMTPSKGCLSATGHGKKRRREMASHSTTASPSNEGENDSSHSNVSDIFISPIPTARRAAREAVFKINATTVAAGSNRTMVPPHMATRVQFGPCTAVQVIDSDGSTLSSNWHVLPPDTYNSNEPPPPAPLTAEKKAMKEVTADNRRILAQWDAVLLTQEQPSKLISAMPLDRDDDDDDDDGTIDGFYDDDDDDASYELQPPLRWRRGTPFVSRTKQAARRQSQLFLPSPGHDSLLQEDDENENDALDASFMVDNEDDDVPSSLSPRLVVHHDHHHLANLRGLSLHSPPSTATTVLLAASPPASPGYIELE